MYSRKTTMPRLINRLVERTLSLVSALRALVVADVDDASTCCRSMTAGTHALAETVR